MSKFNNPLKDNEKKIILNLYNEGYNTVYIAKELNRDSSSVQRYLKKNGYQPRANKLNITKVEEMQLCKLYQEGKTSVQIAEIYKHKIKSDNTVRKILRRNEIEIREAKQLPVILREDFFENIDSEEKAYVLGLAITDGYIIHDKRGVDKSKVFGITLKSEDEYMLYNIKNIIGVESRKIIKSKVRSESIFTVCSNKITSDLSKFGVVERKSPKTYVPKIDKKFESHLIRGIFDGDGTVFMKKNILHFGFYGTNLLVNQIKSILINKIGISDNKITNKESVSFVAFTKKTDVVNFYNYLYGNSTIYLERKRNLFEKYIDEKYMLELIPR